MSAEAPQLRQFKLMVQNNTWVNRRIYDLAGICKEEERRRDLGAFFHSIHRTLNHILLTDRSWIYRFATTTPFQFRSFVGADLIETQGDLSRELYSDFGELRHEREKTDVVLETFVSELCPEMLLAPMRYANSQGLVRLHPLWFAVAHLFNHQTHHRGQVTTLLQQLGHDYGVTDLLAMYYVAPEAIQTT